MKFFLKTRKCCPVWSSTSILKEKVMKKFYNNLFLLQEIEYPKFVASV